MTDQKHPEQPLYKDEDNRLRFKLNAIVRYLLDAGGIDFYQLALIPFSVEDRKQFYQLTGCSWGRFQEGGFVSLEEYNKVVLEWCGKKLDEEKERIE